MIETERGKVNDMFEWCSIFDWKEDGSPRTMHSGSTRANLDEFLSENRSFLLVTKFDNTPPRFVSQNVRQAKAINCLLVALDISIVHVLENISQKHDLPFKTALVVCTSPDDADYLRVKDRAFREMSWEEAEAAVGRAISEKPEEMYFWKYAFCSADAFHGIAEGVSAETDGKVAFAHDERDDVFLGIVPPPSIEYSCTKPGRLAEDLCKYLFYHDKAKYFADFPEKHRWLDSIRNAWLDVAQTSSSLKEALRAWKGDTIRFDDIVGMLCWNGAADAVAAGVPIEDVLA